MPSIYGPILLPGLTGTPSANPDDDLFSGLFDLGVTEGAQQLQWEQASACQCLTVDTFQPVYGCAVCGGTGIRYLPARTITGLFRARGQWLSYRRQGEFELGDAELTTPLSVKPGFTSRLIRDRFQVVAAVDDATEKRFFYPAAPAVPFLFNSIQRAWRVQLQEARRDQDLSP